MAKKSLVEKQKRPAKFKVQAYTRCRRCGRPRGVFQKFGICRICFRELASIGHCRNYKELLVNRRFTGITIIVEPPRAECSAGGGEAA